MSDEPDRVPVDELPDVIELPYQPAPPAETPTAESPAPPPSKAKKTAPWRGRPRVTDPRSAWLHVRVSAELLDNVSAAADAAGLSRGAFVRRQLSGDAGPRARRRPSADRQELAKLLAELGKLGSNHNQLARVFNASGNAPGHAEWSQIERDIQAMRAAILKALGHGD